MFNGFVYYKSPKDFNIIYGIDGLMDSTFIGVYKERVKLWKAISNDRINYSLNTDTIVTPFLRTVLQHS
jgi:hypothetical protein